MNRFLLSAALAFVVTSGSFAERVTLLKPAQNETVPLLTDAQKAYIRLPASERHDKFADRAFRSKMGMMPEIVDKQPRKAYWPKTVELQWSGKPEETYRVKVFVKDTDRIAYEGDVKGGSLRIDNLEIARTYTWQVKDGSDVATGVFTTEDRAPRLLRFPHVPNVRDLGGRVGLDGRRVKQGLVFRTAGLNDNASDTYYSMDELKQMGRLEEVEKAIEKDKARLAQLEEWRKNITFFDRKDPEYVDWCTRHPDEPPSAFLKSRIARAKDAIKKGSSIKVKKGRQAGKTRFTDEERDAILAQYRIKSDIDLRSDAECYGMTGSPYGPSVTWFHISSSGYGGMQKEDGRQAFAKVFKVFLDEKNYPIDFHCIAGQDRTGSVAYILNALLGVSDEELALDWEVSGFWNHDTAFNHRDRYDHLVRGFQKKFPAKTTTESVEKYILSLGFTEQDIAWFRNFMLEKK